MFEFKVYLGGGMRARLANRLETLERKTLAFLDCGKRGGAPILEGLSARIGSTFDMVAAGYKKTSAHGCASRKLVDEIAANCDAVVYGVVN